MGFGQRQQYVEKYHAIRMNAAILGIPLPIVLGQGRVSGKLVWYGDFTANKAKQQGGSGLGKGGTQYVYAASVVAAVAMGPINALLSVWDGMGKYVIESTTESYTIASPYTYNPILKLAYAQDQGVALPTSYSYPVNDYGSGGPTTLAGTTNVPLAPAPGAVNASDQFADVQLDPASWTVNEGSFFTGANTCQISTVGGDSRALAHYNGVVFGADQTAQCVVASIPTSGGAFGVAVRAAASAETFYGFYESGNMWFLFKVVAGVETTLDSAATTAAVNDLLTLSVIGTTLTAAINGVVVSTKTDSSISSGQPGITGFATYPTGNSISNWAATSLPTPTTGQYAVNFATGAYTFASADNGKTVQITYGFYRYVLATEELSIVPFVGPYTVTVQNATTFKADLGVVYDPSGVAFASVSGSPGPGQYHYAGSGTYDFNAADAGQGIIITYEYNDPNTDNNAPQHLNLTLLNGAKFQAPWSYLTSAHPSQALGYTQVASIASSKLYLGYSPEMPNYSYEVAGAYQFGGGIVDANPADCITAVLSDPGYGIGFPLASIGDLTASRACWTAYSFFISPVLENQQSCASVVGEWLEAGMVAAYWSEGLLKFVPYCDTSQVGNGVLYQPPTNPVAFLTDDDFVLKDKADDPVRVQSTPWMDSYNRVQVAYNSRVNDYNPHLVYEQDEASVQRFGVERIEDPKSWDFITTLLAAQYAASMRLQRSVYVTRSYEFVLTSSHAWLEPMDVVALTDTYLGLNSAPVRIQKIVDDPVEGLTVTAEDFIYGVAAPAINPKQLNSPPAPLPSTADPGDTSAVVFEVPARLGFQQGNTLYGFVNGSNENWGGCNVWISFDGETYKLLARVDSPAKMGSLTANLASYSGANPDNTNTLSVEMVDSTPLPSTTSSGAAANVTLCAILSGGPTLELLSYQTAALTAINQYNLTTLYRGVYGTLAGAHSTNDLFAKLDEASFQTQFDPTYVGKTISYKFTSFNLLGQNEQSLASVAAHSFVLNGTTGGIALDTGFVGNMSPAYAAYRPLTNPLTAIDAGSSDTIVVASFTMQMASHASINYNAYSITGLARSTLYYVYVDDPNLTGGSLSFGATTTKETAFNGTSRFYVGSILTPAATAPATTGNGDGGVGAQFGSGITFLFGAAAPFASGGTAAVTNSNNAIDGDLTTFAGVKASQSSGTGSFANLTLSAASPTSATWKSLTISILSSVPTNTGTLGASGAVLNVKVNGVTTTVYNLGPGVTRGLQVDTVSIPINTNLALVSVEILTEIANSDSGTVIANLYEAWVTGVQ